MKSTKTVIYKKGLFSLIMALVIYAPVMASYEDALKLYQGKDYAGSLKILAEELNPAEDMTPDSPNYNLRYLAAHCHWKLGNTQSVIAHFQKCMQIKKEAVEPYIDLSFFAYDIKDYGYSEVIASRGLKVSNEPLLYYILGKIALMRKNYWRAKALFEKVNSLNPELYISYNALGITLMNLKKYSEANTAFSVAIALKPQSPEILNNLARSYEVLGNYQKAKEYIDKAKSFSSDNSVIQDNLLNINTHQQDIQ